MTKWILCSDKWERLSGNYNWICPECGHTALDFVGGSEDWWCVRKPNYCPFCGEKMDGSMEETPRWFASANLIEPALENAGISVKTESGEIKDPLTILGELAGKIPN